MSERLHPAVTAITRTQIVIMGGESSTGELLSDILILDTNTLSISQAIADSGINFKCESQTIAIEYGCALSFVTVEEYDFQQDDSFSSLSAVADMKPSLSRSLSVRQYQQLLKDDSSFEPSREKLQTICRKKQAKKKRHSLLKFKLQNKTLIESSFYPP